MNTIHQSLHKKIADRQKVSKHGLNLRFLFIILLSVLFLYGILPQIGHFKESITVLRHIRYTYAVSAALVMILTFVWAATTYYLLSLKKLQYGKTLVIEIAAAFTNRLLPAGIGGISLHVDYLHKLKHTITQASTVVALNNVLGLLGHGIFLGLVIIFADHSVFKGISSTLALDRLKWAVTVVVLVALLSWFFIHHVRMFIQRVMSSVQLTGIIYARNYNRVILGLFSSIALTTTYVFVFFLCCQAADIRLGIAEIFVIFTTGVLSGTVTPTPGGLVGVEAGLVGSMIAFHTDSAHALTAVLLYRLLTYWLPLVPGYVAFVYAQRQQIV